MFQFRHAPRRRRCSFCTLPPCFLQHGAQCPHQFGPGPVQFIAMFHGQRMQQPFAGRGQTDVDLATVFCRYAPHDRSTLAQTVDQLNGAVMPDLQPGGQLADGGYDLRRQSCDREQKLVLLRFKTVGARRFLAVAEKTPDVVSKFRQRAKAGGGKILRHSYIVSRYIFISRPLPAPQDENQPSGADA